MARHIFLVLRRQNHKCSSTSAHKLVPPQMTPSPHSAGASASCCAVTSCRAPLLPLLWLVVTLPLFRPRRLLPSAGACASCRAIASHCTVASCASRASSPAGCLVTYLHAAASHPPVPPPLITPLPLIMSLSGLTQTGCRLASPHAAASHLPVPPPLIAPLPLLPLVWLVIVSFILKPPHPISWHLRLSLCHCLSSRPFQASCPADCHVSPLLTPTPPIYQLSCRRLSSHPAQASRLVGCCIASSYAAD
jgi:hypothetical protein